MAANSKILSKGIKENSIKHAMTTGSQENKYRKNKAWADWSEKAMREVADMCEKGNTFEEIYRHIAAMRYAFEKERGIHAGEFEEYSQSDFFGRFRCKEYASKYYDSKHLTLSSQEAFIFTGEKTGQGAQSWYMQAPHVHKFVEDKYKFKRMYETTAEILGETVATIYPLSGNFYYQTHINRSEFGKELRCFVVYPDYDDTVVEAKFAWEFSETLFEQIKQSTNPDELLKNLGKLVYFEAQLMRTYRGAESIVQIIMGGIAYYKNYILGEFNELDISWCIRALITNDINEYSEWFMNTAFSSISSMKFINEHPWQSCINQLSFWRSEPPYQLGNTALYVESSDITITRVDTNLNHNNVDEEKLESYCSESPGLFDPDVQKYVDHVLATITAEEGSPIYEILSANDSFQEMHLMAKKFDYADFKTNEERALLAATQSEGLVLYTLEEKIGVFDRMLTLNFDYKLPHTESCRIM